MRNLFAKSALSTLTLTMTLAPGFSNAGELDALCKRFSKQSKKYVKSNNGKDLITSRIGPKNIPTKKAYAGCNMDQPWIEAMGRSLCDGDKGRAYSYSELINLKLPERVLFFIGGAAGFNAEKAVKSFAPDNLTGTEGKDLIGSNYTGFFLSQTLEAAKWSKDDLIYLYAGSGFKRTQSGESALQCIQDLYQFKDALSTRAPRLKFPKIALAGYSNGGALAVEYQDELGDKGISLDLVFAIDPIVQTHKYLFEDSDSPIGQKHPLTKRLISTFQKNDYGTFYPLELRGREVTDADINLELKRENTLNELGYSPLLSDGKRSHIRILSTNLLRNLFTTELLKLKRTYSRY